MGSPARALAAALLAAGLATGCSALDGNVFQPTLNSPLPLDERSSVGQSLTPSTAAVASVDLQVATFGETADPDGTLIVVARDGVGGPELATAEIDGEALTDNSWAAARFDEPVRTEGLLAVEVTWSGVSPLGLWANVPPGPPGGDRLFNDPYPGGELLRDGQPAAGDLAIRVVGEPTVTESAASLARLGAGLARGLAGAPAFAVVWLLLLAGALTLVLRNRDGRAAAS